jgi:hypothetical protein
MDVCWFKGEVKVNGLQILRQILAYLAAKDPTWNAVLNGVSVTEVPADRKLEISRAVLHWSDAFDPLLVNGYTSTGFTSSPIVKVSCSTEVISKLEFMELTATPVTIYPNFFNYLNDEYSKEFFITHLEDCLPVEKITTSVYLDEAISGIPFITFDPSHQVNAEYAAIKLGYNVTSAGTCIPWFLEPSTFPISSPLPKANNPRLLEMFKVAMQTADPYHQYIEFYHLIEYRFYEGLLQKLISLKASDPKRFFKEISGRNKFSELEMFQFVFEQLARQRGFTGNLDVTNILTHAPLVVSKFCNSLNATDTETWCRFLYQIRCGIVHTKEGEEIFDRDSVNDDLLREYVLPFMRDLSVFLIEKP